MYDIITVEIFIKDGCILRILILSASTGGGHMRTSAAMKKYIEANRPNDIVRVVDTLEEIGHLYNKTISEGYEMMAKTAPNFYGAVYNSTNKDRKMTTLAAKFQKLLAKKLLPLMIEFRPDVLIGVHAFCVDMASALKIKYKMNIPIISLITDFAPHFLYVQEGVDKYVVSNEEMVTALEEFGVDRSNVQVSGIPIDPVFYNKHSKKELMKRMGLNPNLQTVLLMAGSFGVRDIFKIYRDIVETDTDFQMIVVTGRNKRLFDEFDAMLDKTYEENDETLESGKYDEYSDDSFIEDDTITENRESNKVYAGRHGIKPTKLLYFVDNINEYMYIADLIVTKPGGLTVSEAIASTLPMAIFKAYPGQEEDNAVYLERNNMAVRLPKKNSGKVVHDLLLNPKKLNEMKKACQNNYRENSAGRIIELAETLVKEYASKDKWASGNTEEMYNQLKENINTENLENNDEE